MLIRRFHSGDASALRQVFHSAVHNVASADYSQEQIQAWAPSSVDTALWRQHMESLSPFVAIEENEIVGYADVQKSGYIDHFYVSGYHPRRGIGTLLMRRLHDEALDLGVTNLTSDVSRTAQPFFARFGFEVVEYKSKAIRGVVVPNALMRKTLGAGTGSE
jgi:putative acetyltransferase